MVFLRTEFFVLFGLKDVWVPPFLFLTLIVLVEGLKSSVPCFFNIFIGEIALYLGFEDDWFKSGSSPSLSDSSDSSSSEKSCPYFRKFRRLFFFESFFLTSSGPSMIYS